MWAKVNKYYQAKKGGLKLYEEREVRLFNVRHFELKKDGRIYIQHVNGNGAKTEVFEIGEIKTLILLDD